MVNVGAVLLILKCFNNATFFNVVCFIWKIKCWMLLMHGVTVKFGKSIGCKLSDDDTKMLKHVAV